MTSPDHDRLRELTAAHVLGALDADDRAEIEAHLDVCEQCRRDVLAFAPLPALLGRLDPDDVAPDEHLLDAGALVAAVRADVAQLERSRRRWRRGAAVAAAAVVVLTSVLGAGLSGGDDARRRSDGVAMAVTSTSPRIEADVLADERPWGTYVHVSATGLPPRDAYAVWTVDAEGAWEPVGTWAPTPDGTAQLGCSTALSLAEIDRVVITSDDRDDELLIAR